MSAFIPVCGEMLWLELFILINFVFTVPQLGLTCASGPAAPRAPCSLTVVFWRVHVWMLAGMVCTCHRTCHPHFPHGQVASLVESVIVLAIAYHEDEHILPAALHPSVWALAFRGSSWRVAWEAAKRKLRGLSRGKADDEAELKDKGAPAPLSPRPLPKGKNQRSSVALIMQGKLEMSEATKGGAVSSSDGAAVVELAVGQQQPATTAPAAPPPMSSMMDQEDVNRLIFFENLFFRLDVNGSSAITFDEMRRMLAFTALDMSSEEVDNVLKAADSDTGNGDGQLDRHEFVLMCCQYLWRYPIAQIEAGANSFAEFRLQQKRRINAKWQHVAHNIDQYARFWCGLPRTR